MPVTTRPGSPFLWYDFQIDGRRFRGSTKTADARKARLIEAQRYDEAKRGMTPVTDWRLRDVFGAYWSEHARHCAGSTDIFFKFEVLSEFLGADLPATKLTNAMLLDYRAARRGGGIVLPADMIDSRPKSWIVRMIGPKHTSGRDGKLRAVTPQSVNRDLAHLRAALYWARDVHGRAIPTLAWKQLLVREAEHRVRFADADEFARLMTAAHPDLRPIILMAVTTGLRRSNILDLGWHQISLASSTITIPRSKGRRPGTVSIAPALRATLALTPVAKRTGRVFDTTNFRRRWAAAVKDAGLVDFHFHDLRHTFASWARQNGADIADICDALMHSSVSVTMRYAHIRPGQDVTAFDRVAQLLGGARAGLKKA